MDKSKIKKIERRIQMINKDLNKLIKINQDKNNGVFDKKKLDPFDKIFYKEYLERIKFLEDLLK